MCKGLRSLWWLVPPALIVAWLSYEWRDYQLDDALIYMRYVRNALEGNGLVYNIGERFNGLTSPMFSLLVLGASLVTGSPQAGAILVSALGLYAAGVLGALLFARKTWQAAIIASLVCVFEYFYYTFGMETTVYLATIGLLLLLAKRHSAWVYPVAALVLAVRGEGIFLAAPLVFWHLVATRRLPKVGHLIGAVAIGLAPFVFNRVYYGGWLPGTASAKFGQGRSGFWGESWAFFQVKYLLGWTFEGSLAALLVCLGFAVVGVWVHRASTPLRLLVVFLALYLGFCTVMNMPNYHWYYGPFLYALILGTGAGVAAVAEHLAGQIRAKKWALAVVAAIALLAFGVSLPKLVLQHGQGRNEPYAALGTWLSEHAPTNASVAAIEIGSIGWYSHLRVIDILGLVNPYNANYIAQRDVYSWLTHYQPDYVVCHRYAEPLEASCPLLQDTGLYRPVPDTGVESLILLKKQDGVTAEIVASTVAAKRPR